MQLFKVAPGGEEGCHPSCCFTAFGMLRVAFLAPMSTGVERGSFGSIGVKALTPASSADVVPTAGKGAVITSTTAGGAPAAHAAALRHNEKAVPIGNLPD